MVAAVICLVFTFVLAISLPLTAQPVEQTLLHCVIIHDPSVMDGDLSDACWTSAPKTTDFYDHDTGIPASEKTEAWICCDNGKTGPTVKILGDRW